MLLPMTVQPLVQLGAVSVDLIDEGVPEPSELAELPFQVIALGSKVVSVITNDEPCHWNTFFSSSRARSINQTPMAAEWRIARVDSRPCFSSSFQSQTPMARRRVKGASRVSPVDPHSRHKLLVRIDSAQRRSSRVKSAKASDNQLARWMVTSLLAAIS